MQSKLTFKTVDIETEYIMSSYIASGATGVVYRGFRKADNFPVAIKVVNKQNLPEKMQLAAENQIFLLFQIDHPNIIKLFDVFQTKNQLYLVMQIMKGGQLIDRIIEKQHYSEAEAKKVFLPILDALRYLHTNNVIHRDLKPQNILYQSNQVDANIKLADFGMSKYMTNKQQMTTHVGTPGYWAPEVINTAFQSYGYDQKADYWSLGVLLYILLSGQHPFNQQLQISEQQELIRKGMYSFQQNDEWKNISQQAKDLIKHMLDIDPNTRYGSKQILQHDWVKGQNNRVNHLMGTTKKLQTYNKVRKWKRAKLALDFITRLQMLLKNKNIGNRAEQRMTQSIKHASKHFEDMKKQIYNTNENHDKIKNIIRRAESIRGE